MRYHDTNASTMTTQALDLMKTHFDSSLQNREYTGFSQLSGDRERDLVYTERKRETLCIQRERETLCMQRERERPCVCRERERPCVCIGVSSLHVNLITPDW